jgi:hypothetical protein
MPLVRIDMHAHLAGKREQMGEAIHDGLVEGWEMPADDLFQIFRLHDEGDLRYSRTFPEADRTDIVFIQILAFNGYSPEVKQRGCANVVERLKAVGIKPDNILIALTENGDGDWFAPSAEA